MTRRKRRNHSPGFKAQVAIVDWTSRRVLAWRLSNTLTTVFCVDALQEAITRYGKPEIFNTDQGSQFTSLEFTQVLKDNQIAISMDGKGCWRDNVFVERLWKSVKYEEVYLKAYDSVSAAKASLGIYFNFYNTTGLTSRLTARRPIRSTSPACRRENLRHDHRVIHRVASLRSRPTFGCRHRG